jgi:hypothetical protein
VARCGGTARCPWDPSLRNASASASFRNKQGADEDGRTLRQKAITFRKEVAECAASHRSDGATAGRTRERQRRRSDRRSRTRIHHDHPDRACPARLAPQPAACATSVSWGSLTLSFPTCGPRGSCTALARCTSRPASGWLRHARQIHLDAPCQSANALHPWGKSKLVDASHGWFPSGYISFRETKSADSISVRY